MIFEAFDRIKNFLIVFYILYQIYIDGNIDLSVNLVFYNMLFYFLVTPFTKKGFETEMIIHHVLCIIITSVYKIYVTKEEIFMRNITIEILKVEISSIFLLLNDIIRLFVPKNKYTEMIKFIIYILFISTFIYYRIYKSYFTLNTLVYMQFKSTYLLTLISFFPLFLLNIYWGIIISKKVYKLIFKDKPTEPNVEKILKYTLFINIFLSLYFIILYPENLIKNLVLLFGSLFLSYASHNFHDKVYKKLLCNENIYPLSKYLFDYVAIQINMFLILISSCIKFGSYSYIYMSILNHILVFFVLKNYKILFGKNSELISESDYKFKCFKLICNIPFVLDILIIAYMNGINIKSLNLIIIMYIITTSFIIKPFYGNNILFIHGLVIYSFYKISSIINQ